FVAAAWAISSASAQTFSSGSTGADGALVLTAGDQTVSLPDSGILNYTTVNIPSGRRLTFTPNLQNTPVVMLAQGDVSVAGTIDVSAQDSIPGPGGFYGGDFNNPGFGPGGGTAASPNGQWVGPLSLVPIIGGSGAAGAPYSNCGYRGGAGGGAVVIASSGSITVSGGWILASRTNRLDGLHCWAAMGAPGAIRLVANSITVSQYNGYSWCNLDASLLRLEAPLGYVNA